MSAAALEEDEDGCELICALRMEYVRECTFDVVDGSYLCYVLSHSPQRIAFEYWCFPEQGRNLRPYQLISQIDLVACRYHPSLESPLSVWWLFFVLFRKGEVRKMRQEDDTACYL